MSSENNESFDKNKAVIERFIGAINEGDTIVIDELIHPDYYNYAPKVGEETAAEVVRQLTEDLMAAFPDLEISAVDFSGQGDRLSFTLTLSGTHLSELYGAPATNESISWTSDVTCRFSDGKFAFHWPELTTPEALVPLRQIGLVPPPEDMDKPGKYPTTVPEIILRLLFTGQMADKACSHLELIRVTEPDTDVCQECVELGSVWPALRMCLVCGYVGCCDTAKYKHMKQHYEETGHPIFRSIRLQESWVWCYEDSAFFSGKILEQGGE